MSKQHSRDEIRKRFLSHCWELIDYWLTQSRRETERERMSGCVFSILAMMDGSTIGLPGFLVIPNPHEDDKQFAIDNGDDYFPFPEGDVDECVDIGGCLHELFNNYDPQKKGDRAADKAQEIIDVIDDFEGQCQETEYTDTDVVWVLLKRIRNEMEGLL